MNKSKEEVQQFIDALEDAGYEVTSYSGRGMYGKECVSVNGDVSEWEIARALWFNDEHEDVPAPRRDQLGLGIVLYWPSYEWPKKEV
jgi:hypothetical protein